MAVSATVRLTSVRLIWVAGPVERDSPASCWRVGSRFATRCTAQGDVSLDAYRLRHCDSCATTPTATVTIGLPKATLITSPKRNDWWVALLPSE